MLRQILTFAFVAVATIAPLSAKAGWSDREGDVLFLNADSNGDEYFIVEIDDDEIEITRYTFEDGSIDIDDRDYDLDDINEIVFFGDNDVDGFFNYTDIPSVAYGFGGDDHLVGGSAGDDLYGGWGQDMLEGNGGADFMDAGYDWEEGWCDGGSGYDTMYRNYTFSSNGFFRTYQQFIYFNAENVIYRFPRVINTNFSRF